MGLTRFRGVAVRVGFIIGILLLGTMSGVAHAQADPLACEDKGGRIECIMTFSRTGQSIFSVGVPAFPNSLVTVSVALTGVDGGWAYEIRPDAGGPSTASRHVPARPTDVGTSNFHAQADTHLLTRDAATFPARAHVMQFTNCASEAEGPPALQGCKYPSTGEFRVVIIVEQLPAGVVPSRPAATREDPQLSDGALLDAAEDSLDLIAAWFDDALVGDGLLDVHLALGGWGDFNFNSSAPVPPGFGSGIVESDAYVWYVGFRVLDTDYLVRWFAARGSGGDLDLGCELRRGGAVDASVLIMTPRCMFDAEDAVLSVTFPERSIGSPSSGVLFHSLHAMSYRATSRVYTPQDNITGPHYLFALGGPAVWSSLNPRHDPPPTPPWFNAPLHEENLPDTLQVAGAATAAATFLGGLLLLQGRRRKLRKLLEEVDAVAVLHEENARMALLALGQLDTDVTRRFRAGRVNEAHFQVVTNRIASYATRFALRRELGLDDGTPGDGPPTDAERKLSVRWLPRSPE